MLDAPFSMSVEVPLPDIYQKRVSSQQLKLNTYDVLSFNDFAFNSTTLYNFRVDEETLSKLIGSSLKVHLEGSGGLSSVQGSLSLVKLMMAPGYKLQAALSLERTTQSDYHQQPQNLLLQGGDLPSKKPEGKRGQAGKGGKAGSSGKGSAQTVTPKSV